MPRTFTVSGYEPFRDQEPEDTILHITGAPPEMSDLSEARRWYQDQANDVFEALLSLPQGVVHELLINLLMHRADLYRGNPRS